MAIRHQLKLIEILIRNIRKIGVHAVYRQAAACQLDDVSRLAKRVDDAALSVTEPLFVTVTRHRIVRSRFMRNQDDGAVLTNNRSRGMRWRIDLLIETADPEVPLLIMTGRKRPLADGSGRRNSNQVG